MTALFWVFGIITVMFNVIAELMQLKYRFFQNTCFTEHSNMVIEKNF